MKQAINPRKAIKPSVNFSGLTIPARYISHGLIIGSIYSPPPSANPLATPKMIVEINISTQHAIEASNV